MHCECLNGGIKTRLLTQHMCKDLFTPATIFCECDTVLIVAKECDPIDDFKETTEMAHWPVF